MPTQHAARRRLRRSKRRPQPASAWARNWWGEEARALPRQDLRRRSRLSRGAALARATEVNGPLAQFYRFIASATCCGAGADIGYTRARATGRSRRRTRRARAGGHRDVAADRRSRPARFGHPDDADLPHEVRLATRARARRSTTRSCAKTSSPRPSSSRRRTMPDLTKRPGCSTCHQTLEPMAAYFTRVAESDWTWLPATQFPMTQAEVRRPKSSRPVQARSTIPRSDESCAAHTRHRRTPSRAQPGSRRTSRPRPSSRRASSRPSRSRCSAARSRPKTTRGRPSCTKTFVDGGYRMKALVRAIVRSPRYREGNDARGRHEGARSLIALDRVHARRRSRRARRSRCRHR